MAILPGMPAQEVISAFRGTVDFYLWNGIPCARSWPRWKFLPRTPEVQVYINLLKEAMAVWKDLPQDIRDAYNEQARGSGLMGRDLWIRAYIKGLDY